MVRRWRRVRYLEAADVIYIHKYLHTTFFVEGEPLTDNPIRPDLLESALGAPAHTFDGRDLYPTIPAKAACLFRSLVKNHAFFDGNKRTAVVATMAFLVFNWRYPRAQEGEMYELAQRVANSDDNDLIIVELTAWFKTHIFPRWD
jgi:death-on-curing protein